MFQFMFQFKFVSKMRANGWISEAMFVPAVVIDLVSFITTYLPVHLSPFVIVNDIK